MEILDQRYAIQGVDLLALTKEFGTPVFVYDASKIEHQIKTMKDAFAGQSLRIKYAAKALTNVSILET